MMMMMMMMVVVVVVEAAAVTCPLYGSQNLSALCQSTVIHKLTSSSTSVLILN
jgi:hypothetical protein